MQSRSSLGIQDFYRLSERIDTAGQPTAAQLGALQQLGYETVINLRPLADSFPNERDLVEGQGIEYIQIPVDWEAPADEDVQTFFDALQACKAKRILIHCARNMRVSAFMYLYRVRIEGLPRDTALSNLHHIWSPNATWQQLIDRVLSS